MENPTSGLDQSIGGDISLPLFNEERYRRLIGIAHDVLGDLPNEQRTDIIQDAVTRLEEEFATLQELRPAWVGMFLRKLAEESRPPAGSGAPATRTLVSASDSGAADPEALTSAARIDSMPDREVRQRYHELVDKGIASDLTFLERFELERIEGRLDAESRDPAIEARDRQWETERADLLNSIDDLLVKLRT